MNESFRRFVGRSQHRDEIEAWEREGDQSVWQFLKLSLVILAVAVGAWLLYTQQQFFNDIVAYVGAVGAAVGSFLSWWAIFGQSFHPLAGAQ